MLNGGGGGEFEEELPPQPHNFTGSETNEIGTILLFQKILTQGERTLQMPLLVFPGTAYKLIHWSNKKPAPPLDLVSPNRQNNPLSRRLFTGQDSLALTVSMVPGCPSRQGSMWKDPPFKPPEPCAEPRRSAPPVSPAQTHARPRHAACFFTAAANRLDLA